MKNILMKNILMKNNSIRDSFLKVNCCVNLFYAYHNKYYRNIEIAFMNKLNYFFTKNFCLLIGK